MDSRRKIRVLHVGLDTRLGGIETYLLKISSNIDRENFEFSFLAYDDEKPCFYDELRALGSEFFFVRSRRTSFPGNRKDIRALYRREHFDIVHFHLNSLTYITPLTEAVRCGIPVIAQSRNAGASIGSSSKLLCALNRIVFPYSKVTLAAVSDKAGEWMFGKREVLVLNNGLDTSRYAFSPEKRRDVRSSLGLGEESDVIIHTGAFREQKNHRFLTAVFDEYHKKHENAVLLLVGSGELMDEVKRDVASRSLTDSVIFLGQRNDLPSLLSSADKFLFPSFYEGFPNALLEAEASGLWCVVSDTITREACLENSISLSLSSSVSEWVEALEKPSPDNREEYASLVEKRGFGIKREMERLEKLYYTLSGKTNG